MFKGLLDPFWAPSEAEDPVNTAARRQLTASQLQTLQKAVETCTSGDGRENGRKMLANLGLGSLAPSLADRLAAALLEPNGKPSLPKLCNTFVQCTKGKDADDFCFALMEGGRGKGASFEGFQEVACGCLCWQMGSATDAEGLDPFAEALRKGAFQQAKVPTDESLSLSAFRTWSKKNPEVSATLRAIMETALSQNPNPSSRGPEPSIATAEGADGSGIMPLPERVIPDGGPEPEACLMNAACTWAASPWLPPQHTQRWELLFSSSIHGKSFSTFMGRVGGKGPTLVVIRDKGGAVFGGYAPDPWEKNGSFYGSFSARIFSLLPVVAAYTPSGVNQNFQFCGQGFARVPNGVGWGGQEGYFGLFVDGTLDKGMSRPCATYGNPCLASEEVFEVDVLECWLVQPPPEEEPPPGRGNGKGGSVLDRAEDRNFLSLAGRTMQASTGHRQSAAPPEADF